MSIANEVDLIQPVPQETLAKLIDAADPFISSTNLFIGEFNNLVRTIPRRYGWRFRTTNALKEELRELASTSNPTPHDLNKLYWLDALKNCEAYTVMCVWRMVELSRSLVWSIARDEQISAALLARAALETSAQYLDAARSISKTIEGIVGSDFQNNVVTSSDLEAYLLKTVFASRLSDTETYYQPTNIVTIITRLAKTPSQSDIKRHYEVLCEVAHPNLLGRSVYLLDAKPGPREGDEIREIGFGQGASVATLLNSTIWSLSWSVGTHVSAVHLMQSAIRELIEALKAG